MFFSHLIEAENCVAIQFITIMCNLNWAWQQVLQQIETTAVNNSLIFFTICEAWALQIITISHLAL